MTEIENMSSDTGCGGCSVGSAREVAVVGVRFHNLAKAEHFNSEGFELDIDEPVVVESDDGERFGTVSEATSRIRGGCGVGCMKKVRRRATSQDADMDRKNASREKEALVYCRERVDQRGLSMKLVTADHTLDARKLTFYFTSEGRVDFRELVRDLAQRFHTRIEMRQIGVRDESGVKGGYGPCGRNLCCSSFLKEFAPVSIRMAKEQNLSLNPSKISGMCGRLMCCLRYEHSGKETAAAGEPVAPATA
jgi:cell fate regulator YaaT (PSP1 superfamily)